MSNIHCLLIPCEIFGLEETLTTTLLDEKYRIIEVSAFTTMSAHKTPLLYAIRTMDGGGKYQFQRDLNPRRAEKGSEHVLSNIYTVANAAD